MGHLWPVLAFPSFAAISSERRAAPRSTETLRRSDDFVDGEAEILEQRFGRRRCAEPVDADHGAVEADVLAPVIGHPGFDRDALAARSWQHFVAVRLRLAIEQVRTRHRNDARGNTVFF